MPKRKPAAPAPAAPDFADRPLVRRAISRGLSERYAVAAQEVERILEAAYRVIARDGSVDPRVRDILAEAGLSTQAFYRHFQSKDELLLVLLDDGRRRLADYLRHRIARAPDGAGQVRAWIEGILAQAADRDAAARTRPFLVGLHRLAERYPAEQQASVAVLVEILQAAITAGVDAGELASADPHRDALAVYHLAVAVMEGHVLARTTPPRAEVDHLVGFALAALRP